jgi:hypothetical protein
MSVEAKQEKLEGEQRFAEAITAFQDKCGAKIPVTYDFSSEKGFAARPAWQGFLYCKGVIEGLAAACEFEHAKDRVARAVKAVQCRFEQGSFKKTQGSGAVLGLKSGTLTASYEWTSANLDSEARKWVVQLK